MALAQPRGAQRPLGDVSAGRVDLASAGEAMRRLYGTGGSVLWSGHAATAFEGRLSEAERHGLDPEPFLMVIDGAASEAERDLKLSLAALAYAGALARGLVDPAGIFEIYTLPRDEADLVSGLRLALQRSRVGEWLDGLPPIDRGYLDLSEAYVALAGQARSPDNPKIDPGSAIRIGDRDRRRPEVVAALLRELSMHGSALVTGARSGALWSQADADLLRRYQRSRGLREDGVVGPNTLALLNAGPRDKARRIAVNLERLRWLQRQPPATRIDVNTAASTLAYVVEGKVVWTTPVAPGRPGHETPQIQAGFDQLVVNPPWYVPASIARNELAPRGSAYLRRNHMRREGSRIIQSPGPWAALGQVKFDMRNPYAIYLHDTPSKDTFDRSQRHVSHGCVRVADAVAFARRLAAESGAGAQFDRVLESGRTGVIRLGTEIPVRLIYQTALADDSGAVNFRPDVYGWDVRTAAAMGLTPPAREGVEAITAAPLGP